MSQPSYWELESFYKPQDIIITGSGLTGLWSAYYLKKSHPDLKILVVDKSLLPAGASTRNAGFACFGSLTELLADQRMIGEDKMLELVQMRYQGLQLMMQVAGLKKIDYEQRGGFELITSLQYPEEKLLNDDIEALNISLRRIIKEKKVFRLADQKIENFGFNHTVHLVENKLEGQLHPGRLVSWLMNKVRAMGVTVLHGIQVKRFERNGDNIQVHTNLPVALNSGKLLVCTNAFTDQLLSESGILPARGQVLLTEPIKNLPFKGTFHYDEGFYYFRNLGKRILLGGARNKAFASEHTLKHQVSANIQLELERFLREVILPGEPVNITHRWSGIMGMGPEKIPTIKEVQPQVYSASGLGGMGVALAPYLGKKAATMLSE
jgi:gamma-glutamylputrescine oxidase